MRLLTAGSLVRVQLGEPSHSNPNTPPFFMIGDAFGFVIYGGLNLLFFMGFFGTDFGTAFNG